MLRKLFALVTFPVRHLSYANLMATVAVFIAVGGSAYAVTQINGRQIRERSIPGNRLKLHTVTSHELRDLVVSARHRRGSAGRASDATTPGSGIITLSIDQSAVVLQSGPFTYTARCTSDSDGHPLTTIEAESTEPGSLIDVAFNSSGQVIGSPYALTPGQPVFVVPPVDTAAGLKLAHVINGGRMVAPSGAALIADITYGTQLFGADCWASGFGVD